MSEMPEKIFADGKDNGHLAMGAWYSRPIEEHKTEYIRADKHQDTDRAAVMFAELLASVMEKLGVINSDDLTRDAQLVAAVEGWLTHEPKHQALLSALQEIVEREKAYQETYAKTPAAGGELAIKAQRVSDAIQSASQLIGDKDE